MKVQHRVMPLSSLLLLLMAMLLTACGASKNVERKIEMKDFSFSPETITVPAGALVTLELSNTGALEHEYMVMLLGKEADPPFDQADKDNIYWEHKLVRSQSETVEFTAPEEPGEYQVVCGTAGHLEQGMQGTLIVSQ